MIDIYIPRKKKVIHNVILPTKPNPPPNPTPWIKIANTEPVSLNKPPLNKPMPKPE